MNIDIPDYWIRSLLNYPPDMPVEDALKHYFSSRTGSGFEKHFIFTLGEYALHEMGKNLK